MKRFVIEWGTGVDIHGGNVTEAACRAVKDALSHCCLCGISEVVGLQDRSKMHVHVKIACPYPEKLDTEEVLKLLPVGTCHIDEVVEGGMTVKGMHVADMGPGSEIVMALAALTVYLDI